MPKNELHDHMCAMQRSVLEDYARIAMRVKEDPGTAGDDGEETWSRVIREWIPSTYQVVTKGRVMFASGESSPQVDVIVLKPSYPAGMSRHKHYFAAGVAAAFECKLTLRAAHITAALATAAEIRRLEGVRAGTPYGELNGRIPYGLLAHSHEWTLPSSTPKQNVARALHESLEALKHPRDMLSLLCVADVGLWRSHVGWFRDPDRGGPAKLDGWPTPPSSAVRAIYFLQDGDNPVGSMVSTLLERLAWSDETLRDLVDYFSAAGLIGGGEGRFIDYARNEVLSKRAVIGLRQPPFVSPTGRWSEWDTGTRVEGGGSPSAE